MSLYHNSKEELPVNELLSNINKDLLDNIHTSHYLTCFWGIIDTSTNILTYSRAGHPLPVVLKRDGSIHQLNSAGTFIGILENAVYDVNTVQLEKNDRIFLFTDGIYDVLERNENSKETLGYDRFVQLLSTCNFLPFNMILSTVQNKLSDYSYQDDYTLITIEITGTAQVMAGN
jgi:sigma-B regulation protein RsbU (phosphoserine phosphatase)